MADEGEKIRFGRIVFFEASVRFVGRVDDPFFQSSPYQHDSDGQHDAEKGDGEHRFRERLLPMSRQRNDDANGPGYPALFEAFAVRSRLVTRSSWFAVAGKAAFSTVSRDTYLKTGCPFTTSFP